MTLPAIKHPVELLRDGKGIYGIGISKEAQIDSRPRDLILRRDRLPDEPYFSGYPILQMITGGFRHGMFCHTSEERLRQVIHHEMLRRVGLDWPPPDVPGDHNVRYWSSNPQQQIRNRQIYHGLRLGSLSVINRLIGKALEEAANQEAVKVARQFKFSYRYNIYRATAQRLRALQLAVTFPALAFAIFGDRHPMHDPESLHPGNADFGKRLAEIKNIGNEAATLVEAGAPLKKIADLMRVPMAFRKIKPGAADWTLSYIVHSPWDKRLIHAYMPDSLPRMKLWLNAIYRSTDLGRDFVEWVAKHVLDIPGGTDQIVSSLFDIKDWVRASHRARIPQHTRNTCSDDTALSSSRGEEFVVRAFSPDMSLKTVTKLSSDWHEAVANNMSGAEYEFPKPWFCAAESCGYEIVPIATSADLYREGHALHHCVGAQGDRVQAGAAYFYSVRKRKERVATLELVELGADVAIGDLRGSCNSQVPKGIERAARSWLRSQREFHFPMERKVADDVLFPKGRDVAYDEIPF
jgi:PcfJ-like protein